MYVFLHGLFHCVYILSFVVDIAISLLQKLRQSWEEIEEKKMSAGVSAEQMYVCWFILLI